MFNKAGMMIYKCRRCGEVYANGTHTPDAFMSVLNLIAHGTHYEPCMVLSTQEVHQCKDESGVGIADCVGCNFDTEDEA